MPIDDHYDDLFDSFLNNRSPNLFEKWLGPFRAKVVDTNDPLQMHRIRVKIPELHDHDVKDEDTPWAVPAPWMAGSQAGSWKSWIRDDIVYIVFEKNHPYLPIYLCGADATRRERYVLDSVYIKSPPGLTEDGDIEERPDDYVEDWLPKDFRPMSEGMKDNYGNCFIMKAYGFFPKRHDLPPTPVGYDAIAKSEFEANGTKPKKNEPDAKYMAMYSKYGNFIILNDVGFDWKKEFEGDWEKDRKFERKRVKYFTKAFTEQEYKERDQRRLEMRTRYGHMFEMRDVGWSKQGDREKEYDDKTEIAPNKVKDVAVDHRWIKLRTKGGHLIQMYDKGFDPAADNFIKTTLEEDIPKRQFGEFMDQEGQKKDETFFGNGFWHQRKDGRFIRFVTRYGFKLTLDDRGTDPTQAEANESPKGNGFLVKGRRKGRDDKERGFGSEFNEKDKLQHAMMYSPKSKIIEINDKYDYIMLSTDTGGADGHTEPTYHVSESMVKRADNEFSTKIAMGNLDSMGEIDLDNGSGGGYLPWHPEVQTHHLKLDKKNAYIRLKTHYKPGIPAGVEARCGGAGGGTGKNWTEVVDHQDRGLWFTQDKQRHVLRSQTLYQQPSVEPLMWQTYDETPQRILIINNGLLTQIYCSTDIQIIAGRDIKLDAGRDITMKAGRDIHSHANNIIKDRADVKILHQGSGAHWTVGPAQVGTQVNCFAPRYLGVFTSGDKYVAPGPVIQDSGDSSPLPGPVPIVPKIKKQVIDQYKPDGVDTPGYNKDRAQDANSYESVVRKTDIWGE